MQRTLDELVEDVYHRLLTPNEWPLQVAIGSNGLASATDTTMNLTDASLVAKTDVLEIGSELLLVTAKTEAGVLTVSRGYMGSTPNDLVLSGSVALKNPRWPRHKVERTLQRALRSGMVSVAPEIATVATPPLPDSSFVTVPDDTVDVLRVSVLDSTGRFLQMSRWDYMEDLPTDLVPNGRAVQIHGGPDEDDTFWVTLMRPYRWYDEDGEQTDTPTGTSYVTLPDVAEDLPILWTAATLASGRELSRVELDRVEEWNQDAAARQGVNIRLLRELWAEYYRRVEEVRRDRPVKKHRPFMRMRSF